MKKSSQLNHIELHIMFHLDKMSSIEYKCCTYSYWILLLILHTWQSINNKNYYLCMYIIDSYILIFKPRPRVATFKRIRMMFFKKITFFKSRIRWRKEKPFSFFSENRVNMKLLINKTMRTFQLHIHISKIIYLDIDSILSLKQQIVL